MKVSWKDNIRNNLNDIRKLIDDKEKEMLQTIDNMYEKEKNQLLHKISIIDKKTKPLRQVMLYTNYMYSLLYYIFIKSNQIICFYC